MSLNLNKDLENHYRTLLLLFKPFRETKKNWKKNGLFHGMMHTSIQKTPKKIIHNFNQNGDYNNEWDDLQSQFLKYTK